MSYEFDQSGKLENISVKTVIAFSNKSYDYVCLKPNNKRAIKKWFSKQNKPKIYIYKTFACLLYILIKRNTLRGVLRIDNEYPGNMNLIKSYLFKIFKKYDYKSNNIDITFGLIGKGSKAHKIAISEYRNKKNKEKKSISHNEVLKILNGI